MGVNFADLGTSTWEFWVAECQDKKHEVPYSSGTPSTDDVSTDGQGHFEDETLGTSWTSMIRLNYRTVFVYLLCKPCLSCKRVWLSGSMKGSHTPIFIRCNAWVCGRGHINIWCRLRKVMLNAMPLCSAALFHSIVVNPIGSRDSSKFWWLVYITKVWRYDLLAILLKPPGHHWCGLRP